MADVSKIITLDNSELNLKDAAARGLLNGHSVGKDVPADAVFTDTTYFNATQSTAGLMSAADKTKLDGVATVIISDTEPSSDQATCWIDPEPAQTTQVLTVEDLPGFAGITLTTVKTIVNE